MVRLRSCASSTMIVSYWRSSRSRAISASRTPSVISLTRVESPTWPGNRTFQPPAPPSGAPSAPRVARGRAPARGGDPDLPAGRSAQGRPELLGDPLGHGARGDPPRLGVPDAAPDAPARRPRGLGGRGGLAGGGSA